MFARAGEVDLLVANAGVDHEHAASWEITRGVVAPVTIRDYHHAPDAIDRPLPTVRLRHP